jgi:hypothetical protein
MPKTPTGAKRPADVIGNAVHVMRIATGHITEALESNALRVFEALVEEHEKGAEFSLKRANGETVAYKIFV